MKPASLGARALSAAAFSACLLAAQGPYLITEMRDPTSMLGMLGFKLMVGYLDRDDTLDALYVDVGNTYVFLNVGNGRPVIQHLTYPPANLPAGTALLDLDHDGDLDGLAVDATHEPLVVLNDGNGRFFVADPTTFFPPPGPYGGRIAAGDFDGDGRDDVLVAAILSGQPRLFLRPANSRFVNATATHLPVMAEHLYDLAVADLDQDGDLDVAAAANTGHSRVLWNAGDGHFADGPLTGRVAQHFNVALLDFDRDGRTDLYFAGFRSPSALCLNQGGGSFFDLSGLVANMPSQGAAVGGDVDGDGWDDLVVLAESGPHDDLQLHRNLGGQGFAYVPQGIRQPRSFGSFRMYLRDADFDGDLDLFAATPSYLTPLRYWFIPNTTRHVETLPPVRLGGSFAFNLWGLPGQWMIPLLATRPARVELGGFGVLGLDPLATVTLPAIQLTGRQAGLSFPVPPGSVGVRLYTQALVVDPRAPALTRLTNWMDDVVVR